MPVIIASRFIVEFPFSAGPLGRYGVGEERGALIGCARRGKSQEHSVLNLCCQFDAAGNLFVATNILDFSTFPGPKG
jgi:hypothetical protein